MGIMASGSVAMAASSIIRCVGLILSTTRTLQASLQVQNTVWVRRKIMSVQYDLWFTNLVIALSYNYFFSMFDSIVKLCSLKWSCKLILLCISTFMENDIYRQILQSFKDLSNLFSISNISLENLQSLFRILLCKAYGL